MDSKTEGNMNPKEGEQTKLKSVQGVALNSPKEGLKNLTSLL